MASRIVAAPARITTTAARPLSLTTRQIIESREPKPDRRPIPNTTGAPILLYDQVTVPAGGEQPFKSKALTNNRNRRIHLHEMRVVCTTLAVPDGSHVSPVDLIALQLVIKRKNGKSVPITRGYLPVVSLCKSPNRLTEVYSLELGAASWAFSFPLDLSPGDYIEAQVRNAGLFNSSVTVDLAFAGSDASSQPMSYRVPYATAWQSRDFAYSEVATDTSPPDQLVNDLSIDFHVDRIIGRFVSSNTFGVGLSEVVDFGDLSNQAANYAMLRLRTAQNRPILQSFATFRSVFGQDSSVETNFLLAPGDFVVVDVRHLAGGALADPFVYFFGRGLVSLVGWREVVS